MTAPAPLPVSSDVLAAMGDCIAAVPDMAALSRRVFARFLAEHPAEAPRFLNLDAAVLRMTDESFVLLLGLAEGEGWAAGSVAHWVDLHRNYGPIDDALYVAWVEICFTELCATVGDIWPAAAPGWEAAAARLNQLLLAANAMVQGISQPDTH